METRIVEVTLPNGTTAPMRVADVDGSYTENEGATKTSFADVFDFNGVAGTLEGLREAIRKAFTRAAPDKVRVDLAVELAAKKQADGAAGRRRGEGLPISDAGVGDWQW